jgi:hypothetical protein
MSDNDQSYKTVTGLVNMALMTIGAEPLSSMTGTGSNDLIAQRFWPQARDAVLMRADWPCALIREELVLDETHTLTMPDAEWAYMFDYPSDETMIRIVDVVDEGGNHLPWKIEQIPSDDTAPKILCNSDEAYCIYVYENNDPASYPPQLRRAMVTMLAAELAPRVVGSTRTKADLLQEYEQYDLPRAMAEAGLAGASHEADEGNKDWTESWG